MLPRLPANVLRSRWTLTGIPLVIAALGILAVVAIEREVDHRADDRIRERASTVVMTLDRRLDAYTDVLYAVRGLFQATGRPTHAEFRAHVRAQQVAERYPGVLAVGFAEYATREQLPDLIARVRAEASLPGLGYPEFRVRPPGDRGERLVATYIEPEQGNGPAFGYDFLWEARRRAGVRIAWRSGRPAASAPIEPEHGTGSAGLGFVLFLSVPGDPQRFRGAAYAAFSMDDLVRRSLPADLDDGDLEIRDESQVTFDDDRDTDARDGAGETLDVFGRRWSVAYLPHGPVASGLERAFGWIATLGFVIVAILSAQLLHSLAATERRARRLAERMTRELADSNTELERFAYVASHDLQEPLRSITAFTGLLARQYDGGMDDRGRGYLRHIERSAVRMRELIEDLLAYSRVMHGTPQPCDLGAVWRQAVGNLQGGIVASGAKVTADALPTVLADGPRMVQVFQNLISNAIKYRGEAPPEIHTSARRTGRAWEIAVSDNGAGIDPRYQDKVFELFERLDGGDVDGTGMGLSICKRAIERFGGRIWVESTPGEGTTFRFTLPAA